MIATIFGYFFAFSAVCNLGIAFQKAKNGENVGTTFTAAVVAAGLAFWLLS